MNSLKRFIAPLILLAGGIVFILFGAQSVKEIKTYKPVEAVVSHVAKEWTTDADGSDTLDVTIYVTYTVDGKEYEEALQNTSTNHEKGDKLTVLYNPADPSVVSGVSKTIVVIQLAAGVLLILAGAFVLVRVVIRGR